MIEPEIDRSGRPQPPHVRFDPRAVGLQLGTFARELRELVERQLRVDSRSAELMAARLEVIRDEPDELLRRRVMDPIEQHVAAR